MIKLFKRKTPEDKLKIAKLKLEAWEYGMKPMTWQSDFQAKQIFKLRLAVNLAQSELPGPPKLNVVPINNKAKK